MLIYTSKYSITYLDICGRESGRTYQHGPNNEVEHHDGYEPVPAYLN
jgi:hypothetical protein